MIRALLVVLLLTGCGGAIAPGAASTDPSEARQATTPEPIEAAECPAEVIALVETLSDLRSRLAVGLPFADYSTKVGDAVAARDRIDVTLDGAECVQAVGVPAEAAMILYAEALTEWNACVSDPSVVDCEAEALDPRLQELWADAGDKLEEAEEALRDGA